MIKKTNILKIFTLLRKSAFTPLVNALRSELSPALLSLSPALLSLSPARSSLTLLRKSAFTLVETITVLIIMGVIISITMPTIIKKHSLSVKRIKVKKALTIYDVAIHSMFDEHGFTTKQAFLNWANAETAPDCENTNPYFKKIDSVNGCVFKTADNIWWDISKIDNPIIIFNPKLINCLNGAGECDREDIETLSQSESSDAFSMSFQVDDKTGILHVNDKVFEDELDDNEENKMYMAKLFNFIYEQKFTSSVAIPQIVTNTDVISDVEPFEPVQFLDDNGNPLNGYLGDIDKCSKTTGIAIICNYQDGYAIDSTYCKNGKNAAASADNLPETILNPKTGEKLMFKYNNDGSLKEVQYVKNNLIEVYQKKDNSNFRVAKYTYDDNNQFKQSWWLNPKNSTGYTWSQFQYYYNGKYYLFSITPNKNDINKYTIDAGTQVSDNPFVVVSSQTYSSNGASSAGLPYINNITEADLYNNNYCGSNTKCQTAVEALKSAFSDGYFIQPTNRNEIANLAEIDKLSPHSTQSLQNYQRYICNNPNSNLISGQ